MIDGEIDGWVDKCVCLRMGGWVVVGGGGMNCAVVTVVAVLAVVVLAVVVDSGCGLFSLDCGNGRFSSIGFDEVRR